MLGKLFKHEFKDTGKVLLPLNLGLIGVTIIGMIVMGLKLFEGDSIVVGVLAISMVMVYVFAILALFIVTYVYLMIRFYRSMYSSEGYLTHTLPVSTFSILNTKILVSAFWAFISMVLTVCSILSLVASAISSAGGAIEMSVVMEQLELMMGMSVGPLVAWILLFMLISSFSGLLMIYCSMAIGQLFNKYKVLAAIVTYVIFYIIIQVVSVIVSMADSFNTMSSPEIYLEEEVELSMTFTELFGSTFTYSLVQYIIMIVLFYVTTAFITNKKLNLE